MINDVLDKRKKYLLACSFGPDSMALFDVLKKSQIDFAVAHVNYHLRSESNDEEEQLKAYCHKNNVRIFIYDNTKIINKNIEATCRQIRYDFFAAIIEKFQFDILLVAHHLDDLIETYLMQQKRNNLVTWFGLQFESQIKGMTVMRPLLKYEKKYLLEYVQNNDVPYAIDISNYKDVYLRNQIRHQTVEQMSLAEKNNVLAEIGEQNRQIQKIFNVIRRLDLSHNANLLALDDKSLQYALNAMCKNSGVKTYISKNQTKSIAQILSSNKPNVILRLSNHCYFEKSYQSCRFYRGDRLTAYNFVFKDEIVPIETDDFYFDFLSQAKMNNLEISSSDFPITIRPIRETDFVTIKNYAVPANRLFIDWKMPLAIRKFWPVVVNSADKIIYVPRYRSDCPIEKKKFFYLKK